MRVLVCDDGTPGAVERAIARARQAGARLELTRVAAVETAAVRDAAAEAGRLVFGASLVRSLPDGFDTEDRHCLDLIARALAYQDRLMPLRTVEGGSEPLAVTGTLPGRAVTSSLTMRPSRKRRIRISCARNSCRWA